jgi:integrase
VPTRRTISLASRRSIQDPPNGEAWTEIALWVIATGLAFGRCAERFVSDESASRPGRVRTSPHERAAKRHKCWVNDYGIAALKLFVKHDLFDHLTDRTRVPDETLVPWYQELYYQVVTGARRVKDPYTGASLYFTPHCFRHSFATALAPLIGGDAKTGAKIMGHSPQTFMRYVRANDETARTAVDKMMAGLPPLGQPMSAPAATAALRVVTGGKS